MIFNHLPDTALALDVKIGIHHVLQIQTPGMIFLPDQNPSFVAEIQKQLVVGIMAGAHRICAISRIRSRS